MELGQPIQFRLYNIRNVQNGGLESALHGMPQENVNLDVFKKKNVTGGIYARQLSGYWFIVTEAPSLHCGGVAVLYCEAGNFTLEEL